METKQELQAEINRLKEVTKSLEDKVNGMNEPKLEVGEVYRVHNISGLFKNNDAIITYTGEKDCYGFNHNNEWTVTYNGNFNSDAFNDTIITPVPTQEWRSLIEAECKRRFDGKAVRCMNKNETVSFCNKLTWLYNTDKLYDGKYNVIYSKGKFAEIVEEEVVKVGNHTVKVINKGHETAYISILDYQYNKKMLKSLQDVVLWGSSDVKILGEKMDWYKVNKLIKMLE